MAHNYLIHEIQKSEPMENLKDKLLLNIHKGMENNILSNDDLVQIIEQCGFFLNIKTISDYAKKNNLSYNGVKKFRNVVKIFNTKYVIHNL
jgi:hypothetical protein